MTVTDFSAFNDQYLEYSFNFMFQICVTFSWDIFIKALIFSTFSTSLAFSLTQYASLSFDSTNMILTFVAIRVAMLNNIIEACNSLLFLHDLSSLESSSTIKLSTAQLSYIENIALMSHRLLKVFNVSFVL